MYVCMYAFMHVRIYAVYVYVLINICAYSCIFQYVRFSYALMYCCSPSRHFLWPFGMVKTNGPLATQVGFSCVSVPSVHSLNLNLCLFEPLRSSLSTHHHFPLCLSLLTTPWFLFCIAFSCTFISQNLCRGA